MTSPSSPRDPRTPSAGVLEARVAEIRKRQKASSKEPRAIAFQLSVPWTCPRTVTVDGEELPVWLCRSVLAFREKLAQSEGAPVPPVLLTNQKREDLGQDVLARLDRSKLHRLDAWDALRDRFGVRDLDPRLTGKGYGWMPERLLAIPPSEIAKPASGFLDLDEAWQLLLSPLGFSTASPDLWSLLEWTTRPEGLAAFMLLPADARDAYARRLASDGASEAVLQLVGAGRGREAVAAGLVCELLFSRNGPEDPERSRATGRFEAALLGRSTLTPGAGRAWAEAAAELTRRRRERDGEAGAPWLKQAGELLAELNVTGLGRHSVWLPAGLDHAAAGFAERLEAWLGKPDAARLAEVKAAGRSVIDHGLVPAPAVQAVEGLLRLVRWLTARKGKAAAGSFAEAASSYVEEGSWVDLARVALADAPLSGSGGSAGGTLGAARDRLLQAVLEKREEENRRFAELLAKWSEIGAAAGPMVPLEAVLDRVAAPLADENPVLLLVLDGMSFAVYRELAEDLAERRGWEEIRPQDEPAERFGVALLPTVTQVSRASLLSGERRTGDASQETQAFAVHPGLRRRSSVNLPPVLFHKKDLTGDSGGLSATVREAVEAESLKIVGVVLNVVDDQLPKGGQLLPRWEVSAIRHLRELLEAAVEAGRLVILTADHGHLLESRTELRRPEAVGAYGARYRSASGAPLQAGEVEARGPRVLLGDGTGLILAWSESHRYTAKQSGYHGGASPQEAVVPLSVWAAAGRIVEGWRPGRVDRPGWWDDEGERLPVAVKTKETARPKVRTEAAPPPQAAQASLFVLDTTPDRWLEDLFASPVYQEQKRRASRQPLADDDVAAVLRALSERGRTLTLAALARQRGTTVMRIQGMVATLQKLLNVEGYPVLELDPTTGSVSLDRGLLKTQFPAEETRP